MSSKRFNDERLHELCHQVDCDGIGADRRQRQRPEFKSADVDDPVKSREHPASPGRRGDDPGWGPDPLDDRADRRVQDLAEHPADHAGEEEYTSFADAAGWCEQDSAASTPKIMVAIEGMKFRVAYPPGSNMNGSSVERGKRFKNHRSNEAASIGVFVPVREEPVHDDLGFVRAVDPALKLGGKQRGKREEKPVGEEYQERDGELKGRSGARAARRRTRIRGRSAPGRL